ncbi:MAG: protein kinase [Myxococcales bacterium]|nr:protein kinase [Myxococcales bacterium]
MSAADSSGPSALTQGFSKLEALPEGFAQGIREQVEPGDIIGERYRIVRPIGHGAMGKVFLAENLAIGLRVAVKLLKPELLANPDFRLRFKHEAEAVAAIQHQNVARFLDLIVGDPTFLVMEHVEGPTLHQVIAKEGKLHPRRAADIAVRLAWGLHAAHSAGIVHRDLKPSNILLQRDEEAGEVPKIIDFGLAKTAAQPAEPLTRVGQIVGTPQYMAPEQIARKEIDARTDVYALGCVVYAMLCGRAPFADTGDDMQLLYRQVHEPVESVRRHAPDVPEELEAVVLKALAKDPNARFQSAREFAKALVPAVEKRAARRDRSLTTEIAKLPPSRAIAWWTLLTLALAMLVAAGAIYALRARHPAMLLVISNPPGASIEVDGRATGEQTPTSLLALSSGEHTVKLRHAGFGDLERVVRIDATGRALVDAHLLPRSHSIELTTVPAGASVYLDGAPVAGKTPLSFDLVDGEYHSLRIEKAGYETALKRLKPDDAGPLERIVLVAETVPRATVFVESNMPAEVWVDELYSGFLTPTPGLRLTPGQHRIELRDGVGGAVLADKKLDVAMGDTVRVGMPIGAPKRAARR